MISEGESEGSEGVFWDLLCLSDSFFFLSGKKFRFSFYSFFFFSFSFFTWRLEFIKFFH